LNDSLVKTMVCSHLLADLVSLYIFFPSFYGSLLTVCSKWASELQRPLLMPIECHSDDVFLLANPEVSISQDKSTKSQYDIIYWLV